MLVVWCLTNSIQWYAQTICTAWPKVTFKHWREENEKPHHHHNRSIDLSLCCSYFFSVLLFAVWRTFILFSQQNYVPINRISQQLWCGFRWTANHIVTVHFFTYSVICQLCCCFFFLHKKKPLNIIIMDKCASTVRWLKAIFNGRIKEEHLTDEKRTNYTFDWLIDISNDQIWIQFANSSSDKATNCWQQ